MQPLLFNKDFMTRRDLLESISNSYRWELYQGSMWLFFNGLNVCKSKYITSKRIVKRETLTILINHRMHIVMRSYIKNRGLSWPRWRITIKFLLGKYIVSHNISQSRMGTTIGSYTSVIIVALTKFFCSSFFLTHGAIHLES